MAAIVLTLAALGEIAVGIVMLTLPQAVTLLIEATLEPRGLLIARMLGCAVLALGLTWWLGRREVDPLPRLAPGFFVYNVGIGVLFIPVALGASRPLIPWLVCLAHLGIAAAFAIGRVKTFSGRPS